MKKTWRARMLLRMPVRSSFLLQHRPGGVVKPTSSSSAMMAASVVLPKPGRAVEQHVVHGFAALAGGLDGDGQVLLELALAGEIGQPPRAQPRFELQILGLAIAGNQFPVGHCYQLTVPVPGRGGKAARSRRARRPDLALRTAASACGRAQPRLSRAESTS